MPRNFNKGFTLIELLIVIVIIGVLAVAVLSAINPIEQIKKSQDAGKRSDSAELLNALERYYTAYQAYPWTRVSGANVPPTPGASGQVVSGQTWLTDTTNGLVGVDELKDEFVARPNLASLYVWRDSSTDLVRVCFDPQSQSNSVVANWSTIGQGVTTGGLYMCVPE